MPGVMASIVLEREGAFEGKIEELCRAGEKGKAYRYSWKQMAAIHSPCRHTPVGHQNR